MKYMPRWYMVLVWIAVLAVMAGFVWMAAR